MKKQAVLSLSGGMDSSTLLLHLLANDYEVTALSFDYGQKHNVELERAKDLVHYLNKQGELWEPVRHQIIKLESHSLDESRLAIPLDILFKDFLYVGILKIMFLFIISIFKTNPLSILEVKIINNILLCYLSEKVLSAYAEIKVIISTGQ